MVGHTGDIEATVVACKAADEAVKVRTNKRNYYLSSFFVSSICIYEKILHYVLSMFCLCYLYILKVNCYIDLK
jgi:hypothetical protein